MIVVSDTSVITSLIHVGHVALLRQLYGSVLIPEAVQQELLRTHVQIPGFLETRAVKDRSWVNRLEGELDLGEAEAIVLAREHHADLLLIDEKLGRVIAVREGLRVSGLMGLLLEAKRRGVIASVRDLVGRLETEAGFRLAAEVRSEVFRRAGE